MPKGKNKNRRQERRHEGSLQTSDDESLDNFSVVSNYSENRSEEEDGVTQEDLAEEKLLEVIDGLTQKSSQGRTNCLQTLGKALIKRYMPGFCKERLFTICDSIEKCLKKGNIAERSAAADLASLMCVQLGDDDCCEELSGNLKPVLLSTLCDNSAPAPVRARCCLALSNICFLSAGDLGDILQVMQHFESVFCGSFLKGDRSVPSVTPEMGSLHAAALNAWSLLLTLIEPRTVALMMTTSTPLPTLERLSELLESVHLEVRMASGEALALVFELGRFDDEDFAGDFALEVAESLKQLATDSHKYRAKKDRKTQRATFRDILQFIENDSFSEVQVRFNKESMYLDSWTKRKQYDSLCTVLGPGINIHLAENYLLRNVFEIGDVPVEKVNTSQLANQMERNRKKQLNAANFKARTLSRAKNRDKRCDFS